MGDDNGPVDHWVRFADEAIAEWPWRFHVLNVEQTAAAVCPGTRPERFAELLIAACKTVDEATAHDSTDYVAFAKPPNGWKRGEKSMMRRFCNAVAKQDRQLFKLGVVVETISDVHPIPRPGDDDPWSIKESAKYTPLQTLIWLIERFRGGGVLDVPFDEWRYAEGDFRLLEIFPLIVGSATPHHEIGERFSSSDHVKTTNCMALHTPRGSRDTARKSARVRQTLIYLELMTSVYRQHNEAVRQAWSSADDPVFQFLSTPTRATKEKALLFLWTVLDQQNRRPADGVKPANRRGPMTKDDPDEAKILNAWESGTWTRKTLAAELLLTTWNGLTPYQRVDRLVGNRNRTKSRERCAKRSRTK